MYHAPGGVPNDRAVLIVPPLLNEQMRCNSALRRIALNLASEGTSVLRFDFSGTGNSGGEPADLSLDDWRSDIVEAISELQQISGGTRLSVIGVRFSAYLIGQVLQDVDLNSLVFWDPVLSKSTWTQQLRRLRMLAQQRVSDPSVIGEFEFMGQSLNPSLIDEDKEERVDIPRAKKVVAIITDHESSSFGGHLESIHVEDSCDWNTIKSQRIYPHSVMEAICREVL
jgi:alpha-beta hydrolase superfamily lysophospholipase